MRAGLVSYRCENRNIAFNMGQIERALIASKDKVDVLCFGEAYLQGFDAFCWDDEADKKVAVELTSETMNRLRSWTVQYGISMIIGYMERDGETLYSSCAAIADGKVIHNYRRISKGWKEASKTDDHYAEGTDAKSFRLHGKEITIALCGDLWEYPEKFKTENLLIWPVYVNYSIDEWQSGTLDEYAAQAALASGNVLMVNPIDNNPVNHGGSCYFRDGRVAERIPFDEEGILIVEV